MNKLKLGFTALLTLIMISMFATWASAEDFVPTSTNPATGIFVGDYNNAGEKATHRTHGNFQNNTNSCANCHSTHNAATETLLKFESSEYEMCLSCHDGTMGFYNVLGEGAGAGTFNDTHDSSSMHNVKSGIEIGAAPGAKKNTSIDELLCSSCHNPHGSVNDRLLKESILNDELYAVDSSKNFIPKGTKGISLALTPDPQYDHINSVTGENGLKITKSVGPAGSQDKVNYANFCSTCHDNYLKKSGTVDADGHYSHTTNSSSAGRNCASCHYAHGTDIRLLKDAAGKTVADYVAEGWTQEQAEGYMKDVSASSANKKYTNMTVCWTCHTSSHPLDTPMPDQVGDPNAGTGELWNYVWSDRYSKYIPTFNEKENIR